MEEVKGGDTEKPLPPNTPSCNAFNSSEQEIASTSLKQPETTLKKTEPLPKTPEHKGIVSPPKEPTENGSANLPGLSMTECSSGNLCKSPKSSNIFAGNEEPQFTHSYIFSVNGAPSRRVRRPVTAPIKDGNILGNESILHRPSNSLRNPLTGAGVNSTDELSYRPKGRISKLVVHSQSEMKRPSSSFRNPLTGTGLNSIDEMHHKSSGRKDGNPVLGVGYEGKVVHKNLSAVTTQPFQDGNPLLGVGYDTKRVITDPVPSDRIHPAGYVRKGVAQTPNNHRVPPGGYSTKLW